MGQVLPTESSAPNPRYPPLLHRGIPLATVGPSDWAARCLRASQGIGVQRSRCGRLPNLQRAQRNLMFATIEEARTSMCLSEVSRQFLAKVAFSIRSKSKTVI